MKNQSEKKNRKWPKRVLGALGIVMVIIIVVGAVTLYKTVKTVTSVERVDEGIYKITYQSNYKLDKALAANIRT